MRRTLAVAVAIGLVVGSLVAPAEAAKKKKKKAPAPVATKLFFHGTEDLGEIESLSNLATPTMKMDATPGDSEKSMQVLSYGRGPNPNCAGNNLFPVWTGNVAGTITGDIKVYFDAMSTPTNLEVRVWPDVAGQACNESYIEPARKVVVDIPAGENTVEAVLPGDPFEATAVLMVQLTPIFDVADNAASPRLTRVFYDAGPESSRIEFSCIPASGTSCTP